MRTLFLLLLMLVPFAAFGEAARIHHFEPEVIVGATGPGLALPALSDLLLFAGLALAPAFFTLGLHLGRHSHRVRHVRLG